MKRRSIVAIIIGTVFAATSCRKQVTDKVIITEPATRQVKFSLYTTKNFSNDNSTIQFTVTIRNATKTLWDSTFAPMLVKDIPAMANKINFEKTVPGNDLSQLSVGFVYYIQNVGQSWYMEPFEAGQTVKSVDYNFQ